MNSLTVNDEASEIVKESFDGYYYFTSAGDMMGMFDTKDEAIASAILYLSGGRMHGTKNPRVEFLNIGQLFTMSKKILCGENRKKRIRGIVGSY